MDTHQIFKQFQRQISLTEIGWKGQQKLSNASVTVVGAGGLGCPVLLYLVSCGVGSIHIIDSDKVELSNLHRQVLYSRNDIDNFKAETAQAKLSFLNEDTKITSCNEHINSENALTLLANCSVIVDASDNFSTRYAISDAAEQLGIPVVYGALQGFEGQVSIFNFLGGPTYRCAYPKEGHYLPITCEDNGVLGIIPGIVGTLMANEVLKLLLQFPINELLVNRLLIYDFKQHSQTIIQL
jgi:sulfur-carrier protein adenylyltransferase/sulfurtransferase